MNNALKLTAACLVGLVAGHFAGRQDVSADADPTARRENISQRDALLLLSQQVKELRETSARREALAGLEYDLLKSAGRRIRTIEQFTELVNRADYHQAIEQSEKEDKAFTDSLKARQWDRLKQQTKE